MPANGQISNVSAFVLREGQPVPDDETQVPMFPSEDAARDLLFTVIKLQAEGIRTIAAVNQHLLELEKQRLEKRRNGDTEPHSYQPQDKELRDWGRCVAYFQGLEKTVRRDQHLGPDERVTKLMIWEAGGPHPKTTTRIMVKTHGLLADQWPPSTWPTEAPGDTF